MNYKTNVPYISETPMKISKQALSNRGSSLLISFLENDTLYQLPNHQRRQQADP
jgi:hypothetical protein